MEPIVSNGLRLKWVVSKPGRASAAAVARQRSVRGRKKQHSRDAVEEAVDCAGVPSLQRLGTADPQREMMMMPMQVLSVSVGRPEDVPWRGRPCAPRSRSVRSRGGAVFAV
jgi:hypothetical protein